MKMDTNFDSDSDDTATMNVNHNVLGPYDVICGRHKEAFNNVGNRRFRLTVSLAKAQYTKATTRKEKSIIVRSIMEAIQKNGGRFLHRKRDEWKELPSQQAVAKVGHAVRDMVEGEKANRRNRCYSMSRGMATMKNVSSVTPNEVMSSPEPLVIVEYGMVKTPGGKSTAKNLHSVTPTEVRSSPKPPVVVECDTMKTDTDVPRHRESADSFMLSWFIQNCDLLFEDALVPEESSIHW